MDVTRQDDGVESAFIDLIDVDPWHALVCSGRRIVFVHALLDKVQVTDTDVSSADIVLVAALVRPV